MKWIMVWTADKDMKVNMIFTEEWTTWAVEKEPEKIKAWSGINALSTELIRASWRAGHCEFVTYPMVEITWIEIYEMNYILYWKG